MPISLVEHYFRMYLWGCLKKRLTFESVNSKEDHSHQLGINKATEGLNRTKWKGEFALSAWAERFILSRPKITTLMVLGSSESDQKLYHHSPNSQAFRSKLNYTTGYLVLQSADGKPWDFFFFFFNYLFILLYNNLHNHVSQFHIYIYIYSYIYSIGSVSLENPD